MSFQITHPVKQVQLRHSFMFDFMSPQKRSYKTNFKQSAASPILPGHRQASGPLAHRQDVLVLESP